jgi:hypothetical protein
MNSGPETSADWKSVRIAVVLTAVAMLASCAMPVPSPPLATTFQDSGAGHLACKAGSNCPEGSSRRADRRSQPVSRAKMAEDPPDFIRSAVVQDSTARPQIQMEE